MPMEKYLGPERATDALITKERPAFGGLIFVPPISYSRLQLELGYRYSVHVFSTPSGTLHAVDSKLLQDIQHRLDQEFESLCGLKTGVPQKASTYRTGDWVQITGPVLTGVTGVVVEIKRGGTACRIRLSKSAFTHVDISQSDLIAVQS